MVEDNLVLAVLLKTEAKLLVLPTLSYAFSASLYFPSLNNESARRMAEAGAAEFSGMFTSLYNLAAFSLFPSSSFNVAKANKPS